MTVYLGCYTDSAHPNGLKALCVDETAGRMEVVAEYPVPNALYQTLSPDGAILYSCTGEGLASFEGTGNGEWVMGNGEDVNYTFPLFHNPIWALRATRTGLRPT